MANARSASLDRLAESLTARAATVCRPPAGALVLAAAAAGRLAVPRAHLSRFAGVPVRELLRLAGAEILEVGELDGYAPDAFAAAPWALLIGERAEAPELAAAIWAAHAAGARALVTASAASGPLALLDAGVDLVVADAAAIFAAPGTGIVAGEDAALVRELEALPAAPLFKADTAQIEATLKAVLSAAGTDPAGGRAMPLAGG